MIFEVFLWPQRYELFVYLCNDMLETLKKYWGYESFRPLQQEIITSLHDPEKYILAIVQIESGYAQEPRYVRGALSDHEPAFEHTAIQFNLKRLLERAEVPN